MILALLLMDISTLVEYYIQNAHRSNGVFIIWASRMQIKTNWHNCLIVSNENTPPHTHSAEWVQILGGFLCLFVVCSFIKKMIIH